MKTLNLNSRLTPTLDQPSRETQTKKLTRRQPGFWSRLRQNLEHALLSGGELQVWQKTDRHGERYWEAHDPVSDRSFTTRSETEMRRWIEQRYYAA